MNNSTVRTELKRLVSNIETLAKETQARLDAGASILDIANELVKSSVTMTFALGELYALEDKSTNTTRKPQLNFHNARDSRGRFARK